MTERTSHTDNTHEICAHSRLASDVNGATLHHNSAGFLAGPDMPVLRNFTLGVDGGYTSLMGLRADLADLAMGDGVTLSPRLDLGWQHTLARLTPYQTVSYANAGTSFQLLGTPLAEDAAAA